MGKVNEPFIEKGADKGESQASGLSRRSSSNRLRGAIHLREDLAGVLKIEGARWGQPDRMGVAIEKPCAEFFFE